MVKSGDRHFSLTHLLLCLLMVLCAAAGLAQPQSPVPPLEPPPPAVAASVNAVDIMVSQLDTTLVQMFLGPALKRMIDRELVRQEATQQGISLSDDQLSEFIAGAEASIPKVRRAGREGFSAESYRSEMAFQALLELLTAKFRERLTLMEARAYHEAHKSSFAAGPRIHVFELVTDEIKMAYLATERIRSGEEFTKVAADVSAENQESGGDLGWMVPDDYHLAERIAEMQVGEISPPFAVGDLYYVVHLRARTDDEPVSFDEVREELTSLIAATPRMSFTTEDYLELLSRRANIEVKHQAVQFLNEYYRDLHNIRVVVDDKQVQLTTPVVRLASGGLLVPMKPIMQALHATLTWDEETRSLTAQNPAGKVTVTAESASIEVGKTDLTEVEISEAAQLRDGVLYAPPREILNALGAAIEWDGVRNQLAISSPECPETTVEGGGLQLER